MTTTENTPDIDGLTAVIDSHLEAYALADADRRDSIVATCWTSDGELIDPPMTGRGHAEISGLAEVVVSHYAGHRFRRTTAVDAHHGFARYGWDLVAPDETVAVSGVDFAEFDASGRLRRVVGFFG